MTTTCSTCGTENREGRRFCAECGGPLAAPTCPGCGATNAAGERFCGDCGAPLAAMASSAGSAQLNAETVDEEGERTQLTVLFADVQGSMDRPRH
jgi:predicted amidophosphoribosyltransferase